MTTTAVPLGRRLQPHLRRRHHCRRLTPFARRHRRRRRRHQSQVAASDDFDRLSCEWSSECDSDSTRCTPRGRSIGRWTSRTCNWIRETWRPNRSTRACTRAAAARPSFTHTCDFHCSTIATHDRDGPGVCAGNLSSHGFGARAGAPHAKARPAHAGFSIDNRARA